LKPVVARRRRGQGNTGNTGNTPDVVAGARVRAGETALVRTVVDHGF